MIKKANLILTVLTISFFSISGMAQTKTPVKGKEDTAKKSDAAVIKKLTAKSPELEKAYDDQKFQAAAEILLSTGQMFLADGAQLMLTKEASTIVFNVVIEKTKQPGEYAQLNYFSKDNETYVFFSKKNEKYEPQKIVIGPTSPGKPAALPKWWPTRWKPPTWWPGSGGPFTGGHWFDPDHWTAWHVVKTDCYATVNPICSIFLHAAWMRQEERETINSPIQTQTRWIMENCTCAH